MLQYKHCFLPTKGQVSHEEPRSYFGIFSFLSSEHTGYS